MPSPFSRRQSKARHTGDALHERSFLDHDLRHSMIKAQRGLSAEPERPAVGEAIARRRMRRATEVEGSFEIEDRVRIYWPRRRVAPAGHSVSGRLRRSL